MKESGGWEEASIGQVRMKVKKPNAIRNGSLFLKESLPPPSLQRREPSELHFRASFSRGGCGVWVRQTWGRELVLTLLNWIWINYALSWASVSSSIEKQPHLRLSWMDLLQWVNLWRGVGRLQGLTLAVGVTGRRGAEQFGRTQRVNFPGPDFIILLSNKKI